MSTVVSQLPSELLYHIFYETKVEQCMVVSLSLEGLDKWGHEVRPIKESFYYFQPDTLQTIMRVCKDWNSVCKSTNFVKYITKRIVDHIEEINQTFDLQSVRYYPNLYRAETAKNPLIHILNCFSRRGYGSIVLEIINRFSIFQIDQSVFLNILKDTVSSNRCKCATLLLDYIYGLDGIDFVGLVQPLLSVSFSNGFLKMATLLMDQYGLKPTSDDYKTATSNKNSSMVKEMDKYFEVKNTPYDSSPEEIVDGAIESLDYKVLEWALRSHKDSLQKNFINKLFLKCIALANTDCLRLFVDTFYKQLSLSNVEVLFDILKALPNGTETVIDIILVHLSDPPQMIERLIGIMTTRGVYHGLVNMLFCKEANGPLCSYFVIACITALNKRGSKLDDQVTNLLQEFVRSHPKEATCFYEGLGLDSIETVSSYQNDPDQKDTPSVSNQFKRLKKGSSGNTKTPYREPLKNTTSKSLDLHDSTLSKSHQPPIEEMEEQDENPYNEFSSHKYEPIDESEKRGREEYKNDLKRAIALSLSESYHDELQDQIRKNYETFSKDKSTPAKSEIKKKTKRKRNDRLYESEEDFDFFNRTSDGSDTEQEYQGGEAVSDTDSLVHRIEGLMEKDVPKKTLILEDDYMSDKD